MRVASTEKARQHAIEHGVAPKQGTWRCSGIDMLSSERRNPPTLLSIVFREPIAQGGNTDKMTRRTRRGRRRYSPSEAACGLPFGFIPQYPASMSRPKPDSSENSPLKHGWKFPPPFETERVRASTHFQQVSICSCQIETGSGARCSSFGRSVNDHANICRQPATSPSGQHPCWRAPTTRR